MLTNEIRPYSELSELEKSFYNAINCLGGTDRLGLVRDLLGNKLIDVNKKFIRTVIGSNQVEILSLAEHAFNYTRGSHIEYLNPKIALVVLDYCNKETLIELKQKYDYNNTYVGRIHPGRIPAELMGELDKALAKLSSKNSLSKNELKEMLYAGAEDICGPECEIEDAISEFTTPMLLSNQVEAASSGASAAPRPEDEKAEKAASSRLR